MKNWLVVLLVCGGVVVGGISLYMSSLSGVMAKMGLVGGHFEQAIDTNQLARLFVEQNDSVDCSLWQVTKRVPSYLMSQGEERVVLGRELGGVRVICGIHLVQHHNTERGVYTIIKGLYYLKGHYTAMRVLVEVDPSKCLLLRTPDYSEYIEGYLVSTQGRVHEVVLDLYKQVVYARNRVEELCGD